MEISFDKQKLQKLCNSSRKLQGAYGPECAQKIRLRLAELEAAESLDVLRSLPQCRCHQLKADYTGCLAVDLQHPLRLIFRPDHDPLPLDPAGGLIWASVTRVRILDIVDYH
ncbi:MAG: type II toxin-antitoxin system RelE/ParE family toxin [Planctomycetaceae bacterium]